jgi:DNA-binding FadR family transcriptional regulator
LAIDCPPKNNQATANHASRTAVREAMDILQERGWIEIRLGGMPF